MRFINYLFYYTTNRYGVCNLWFIVQNVVSKILMIQNTVRPAAQRCTYVLKKTPQIVAIVLEVIATGIRNVLDFVEEVRYSPLYLVF